MSKSETWLPRPSDLHLGSVDVHVWRAWLRGAHLKDRLGESILSDDERLRASRFRAELDSDRFIAARAILRSLLGQYLHRSAASIEFTYEPDGKPAIQAGEHDQEIRFNAAHSGDLAAYVFARRRNVGVDIEAVRSDVRVDEVANRFFSSN